MSAQETQPYQRFYKALVQADDPTSTTGYEGTLIWQSTTGHLWIFKVTSGKYPSGYGTGTWQDLGATAGSISLTSDVTGVLPVANGGTGLASLTAHKLPVGNGTSAANLIAVGTTGTVLRGQTGADPVFGAVDLTADVTGVLPIANGGTGSATALPGDSQIVAGAQTTRAGVLGEVSGSLPIGSLYLSTAGKMYLKVANASADTDWERVTTTAAD